LGGAPAGAEAPEESRRWFAIAAPMIRAAPGPVNRAGAAYGLRVASGVCTAGVILARRASSQSLGTSRRVVILLSASGKERRQGQAKHSGRPLHLGIYCASPEKSHRDGQCRREDAPSPVPRSAFHGHLLVAPYHAHQSRRRCRHYLTPRLLSDKVASTAKASTPASPRLQDNVLQPLERLRNRFFFSVVAVEFPLAVILTHVLDSDPVF